MAAATADFQSLVDKAGALPNTECLMLSRLLRLCLPGLNDSQYATCDAEIQSFLADQVTRRHVDTIASVERSNN
jgi:hypothetical protein